MIGTALHTKEIKFLWQQCRRDLVSNEIKIAYNSKNLIKFVLISTDLLSVINVCICDVLLNFLFQYTMCRMTIE